MWTDEVKFIKNVQYCRAQLNPKEPNHSTSRKIRTGSPLALIIVSMQEKAMKCYFTKSNQYNTNFRLFAELYTTEISLKDNRNAPGGFS